RDPCSTTPPPTAPTTAGRRTSSEENDMSDLLRNVLAATVFALLGIVIFVLTFVIVDRVTPYSLWKEIVEEKNTALALLLGAASIGSCISIAHALHSPLPAVSNTAVL